jgi:hypothetical protein
MCKTVSFLLTGGILFAFVIFPSGCKPRCEGKLLACPDNDSTQPSGDCFWKTKWCEGCPEIKHYRGHYRQCIYSDGNVSSACEPECHIQQCTLYHFKANPVCSKRTSIDACEASCNYSVAKISPVDCDCDE